MRKVWLLLLCNTIYDLENNDCVTCDSWFCFEIEAQLFLCMDHIDIETETLDYLFPPISMHVTVAILFFHNMARFGGKSARAMSFSIYL